MMAHLEPHKHLRRFVLAVAGAAPSEATVERCFSVLKKLKDDWRSRMEEDVVEASLQAASCYTFLEECARGVEPPPHRRPARSETPMSQATQGTAASPPPNAPAADEEAEHEEVLDSDEEVEEDEEDVEEVRDQVVAAFGAAPVTKEVFQFVLRLAIGTSQTRQVTSTKPKKGPNTRAATDECQNCTEQCKTHSVVDPSSNLPVPHPGYFVCRECARRG